MRAVISTTHDPKYSFFLPIVSYCWHKLGVKVICFTPETSNEIELQQMALITGTCYNEGFPFERYNFKAPRHKEATYAQCSRLYAGCLDLPDDEIVYTSDVDMAVFQLPACDNYAMVTITGYDLVPRNQFPMCYIAATCKLWREIFEVNYKGLQECLDELLSSRDSLSMRSDFWCLDQEVAYNKIYAYQSKHSAVTPSYMRTKNMSNQFATKRYDRDDAYILDRLSPDTIDFHMPRPGYSDESFNKIITILQYHYPNDNFDWLVHYTSEFVKTLNIEN